MFQSSLLPPFFSSSSFKLARLTEAILLSQPDWFFFPRRGSGPLSRLLLQNTPQEVSEISGSLGGRSHSMFWASGHCPSGAFDQSSKGSEGLRKDPPLRLTPHQGELSHSEVPQGTPINPLKPNDSGGNTLMHATLPENTYICHAYSSPRVSMLLTRGSAATNPPLDIGTSTAWKSSPLQL